MNKLNNLKNEEKAYIAGFLDGDGGIITQIVKNNTYKFGYYVKISIVFYQSTKHHWFIIYLNKLLGSIGTVKKLNNGMSHLTIVKKQAVKNMLITLLPYFMIKKPLAKFVISIISDLEKVKTETDFIKVCEKVDKTVEYTYSKNRKITSNIVKSYLENKKL
jgi:hypothetical protein